MIHHKIFIIKLILIVLFSPGLLFAEDIYIAQEAAGSENGTSCANAYAVTFFNTVGSWDVDVADDGKIGPGDTVRLCGNITTALTFQGSGSAGNVITLLFESGASKGSMATDVWAATGAIIVPSKDYITIDGGATGTIGGPTGNAAGVNGVIQNTDNGTGLGNQADSAGVMASNANYLTVKNLAIYNMYVRTAGTEKNNYGSGVANIATSSNITNFIVTNCIIHDAYIGINTDYGNASSNYTFSYNTIYNCNWGGRTGDRNSSSRMNGLYVHHNKFYDWTNWNVTDTNNFHHNGFYGWAESGGQLTNVYVYANEVGPNYGGYYSTSGVFFSGNVSNIYIYNNLFTAGVDDSPSNGMVTVGQSDGYSGILIANNTFIGGGAGNAIVTGSGTGTYTIQNNLAYDVAVFILFNYAAASTLVADYNFGYSLKVGEEYSFSATSSSSFKTLAQWQALGYDIHGTADNPNLDGSYKLTASSPAAMRSGVVNLAAYFLGGAIDKEGLVRSNWSAGAYEYTNSATATGLTITGGTIR